MSARTDITNQRFGKLVAECYSHNNKENRAVWKCRCDCGNYCYATSKNLKAGNNTSCGCAKKERAKMFKYKDGRTHEKLHRRWQGMLDRCNDPKEKYYCAKGIKVCDEWKDYQTFKKWAYENGYDPKLKRNECQIDRIDPNGDYCPENCRFVDVYVQVKNRNVTPKTYYRPRDERGRFTKQIKESNGI